MAALRRLEVRLLGTVRYAEALALQEGLVEERRAGAIPDTLLSLQHPPTYTLGKRMTLHNLKIGRDDLEALGADLEFSKRGGDITFHGPGQAVLYPILSLRGLGLGARRFVESLEDVIIRASAIHGVLARGRLEGRTGVWVEDRKIGAIGVRISSGGITSHGLAFNIAPDLSYFSHIVPCGLDMEVTSLRQEAVVLPSEAEVTEQLIGCFVEMFGYNTVHRAR